MECGVFVWKQRRHSELWEWANGEEKRLLDWGVVWG